MCGIIGYIDKAPSVELGLQMAKALKHRGPDHQGAKLYAQNHCCLAHARLSIIDLRAAANQPMEYGNLAIVFNGEIYNFKEIKEELKRLGHQFMLDSDTEVILHAYEEWGTSCVNHFIGMFAFAILDQEANELILFRDRAGVKPLYYYEHEDCFMFASELKALYPHPDFHKELDLEGVALYFKFGYIPTPFSIFKGVKKLPPGTYLKYSISTRTCEIFNYWNVLDYYTLPKLTLTYEEAKEQLETILKSACNYRMVSDVPVGVFLSGGYDSVGVTALLQNERTERLKTFTIGFPIGNNEAPIAKEIAHLLGTDHTEYICTPDDCKGIIPDLPYFYDEPFADNSAIPTILVSKLARRQVKVALSADAGDEIFAGYNSYTSLEKQLKYLKTVVKSDLLSNLFMQISKITNPYSFLREKSECFAKLFKYEDYHRISVAFEGGGSLMQSLFSKIINLPYPSPSFLQDERLIKEPISIAQVIDYLNYLPNNILVKVDRATMSVSLEGREPLLDHRIIEFAAQLPEEYKYLDGNKKRIFKDIVNKYVPKEIMDRPKTGFSMPINNWLKDDLRFLVEDNLNDSMDKSFFNIRFISQLKELFYAGKLGHEEKTIWRLIEFQLWHKQNMSN